MTSNDKAWGFAVLLALIAGIVSGPSVMDWLDSETLEFVSLEVPAVEFPVIQGQDTITVEKRWISREDSALAVGQGWTWIGEQPQEGKWSIIRRTR